MQETLVTIGLIIMTIILMVFGMFIAAVIQRKMASQDPLNLQGVTIPGQIIKHRTEAQYRGFACYLTYRYMFEGIWYDCELNVNLETFNAVRDGEMVKVRVLPQDPCTTDLEPIDPSRPPLHSRKSM